MTKIFGELTIKSKNIYTKKKNFIKSLNNIFETTFFCGSFTAYKTNSKM